MKDIDLVAEEVSALGERINRLENRATDVLTRSADVEKVNMRLEEAALITARALQEISGHWDAVYEAMSRRDSSQEP